jgi:hypothetical protein
MRADMLAPFLRLLYLAQSPLEIRRMPGKTAAVAGNRAGYESVIS